MLSPKEESQVGSLYVHVPFCSHKCEYCAFYSELLKPDVVEGYVSALCKELAMVSSMVRPRTLFFGGGTPSILSLAQWERISAPSTVLNGRRLLNGRLNAIPRRFPEKKQTC